MVQIKSILASLTLIAVVLFNYQYSNGQSVRTGPAEQPFRVVLEKTSYLPLEPIVVEFFATLNSGGAKPVFSSDVTMTLFLDGQIRDLGAISPTAEAPQRLPGISRSVLLAESKLTELVSYRSVMAVDLAVEFLSKPGTYQLQFFLHVSGRKIASEVVTVTTESPKGVDLKALRFLKKVKGDTSFDWVWRQKNGGGALTRFVEEFGGTAYSDYGILYLGSVMLARNELEAAEKQFEKLEGNSNVYLAENAEKQLDEIERRKGGTVEPPE